MYTNKEVDTMLSQVEQEFEKAFGSINKNENSEELTEELELETAEEEVSIAKSEDSDDEYETVEELYASMEKSEQEAHYNSLKKVIFGEEEASIAKSEETEIETEDESEDLVKSENDQLKVENEELKKNYGQMNDLINQLFKKKAPEQKAITSTNFIAKSEETQNEDIDLSSLSKSEITNKLGKIDYSTLEKSDREAINEYCLNNGSVNKIKHLIKE
jgi:hypothetical protein